MRALSLIILFCGGTAAAEPDPSQRARELYEAGTTAYDLGHYSDAAHAYEEAYVAKSDPALLFNAGQAYRLGGDWANALRSYRSYLRRVPRGKDRAAVESYITAMQGHLDHPAAPPRAETPPTAPPTVNAVRPNDAPAPVIATGPVLRSRSGPDAVVQMTDDPEVPGTRYRQPVYKKWWLWTTLGAVVAVGVGVGLGVGLTTPNNAPSTAGAPLVTFR